MALGGRPHPNRSPPKLDGIELVVFDKDGTLVDFDAMWSGWSASLVRDLAAATDPALAGPLAMALGLDPLTALIVPGSPLSGTPMTQLRGLTVATLRQEGLSVAQAEAAVAASWDPPDPVALAHPLTDLGRLFGSLRDRGIRVAVATSDDRVPTEATLVGLGVGGLVDAIVCADDGLPVKPAPDALLHLCALLGVDPARTAMIGDSPADAAMGRAAGAGLVLGVLSGVGVRDELEPLADAVISSIAWLLDASARSPGRSRIVAGRDSSRRPRSDWRER
jgi:phosphoglycolate phosphatase-like HAD superfamily hydrolase